MCDDGTGGPRMTVYDYNSMMRVVMNVTHDAIIRRVCVDQTWTFPCTADAMYTPLGETANAVTAPVTSLSS